jgi:electron-transferring-flavoprotein dehydrogenase
MTDLDPKLNGVERQSVDVDVVCVGFGPATAGFMTTLSRAVINEDGTPALESPTMPGMPLQIVCYERADDIGFGVSGVATRGSGIREAFPDLDPSTISMAADIKSEKLLYLLDPVGASRRSRTLRIADRLIRSMKWLPGYEEEALSLPYIPPFLRKDDGLILSIGQFNQWVGNQLMASGTVALWPGTPVNEPLIEQDTVVGVRLVDQGTEKDGQPTAGFMPGMDIKAALTVVGDGPYGPVGAKLEEHFGVPEDHEQRDWALGAKMVVDLRPDLKLEPGTIYHTFGYPEPEIFGFMYVHSEQTVSIGIFVPSWFENPVRTTYRYLQHYMLHPYFWRFLEGGKLRSWGAKSLQESGRRAEPFLTGNGYARIGEGSGSTNILTGSGVDEAWVTGQQLAEGVIELIGSGLPFTKENLDRTYVRRRRESWIEKEAQIAEKARDGFQKGFLRGLLGMGITGLTEGQFSISGKSDSESQELPTLEEYYSGIIEPDELEAIRQNCDKRGLALHDALMDKAGWPAIPHDGQLLVSQQDALLIGGKVQAPPGYADHVLFIYPNLCETCGLKICVEMCSGQAIENDPEGGVHFDREKCVHCGACIWNCSQTLDDGSGRKNVEFRSGTGGLHSAEN